MTAPLRAGDGVGRSAPLDGVRAVAVAAVLAYHAHYGWATGGYLGVDVFFVLSGYLITRVLLSTHRSWWGYGQFLLRRAVRLMPALVVAVAGMTVVGLLTGLPAAMTGRCSAAAAGYVMNLPVVETWTCHPMWHITWSLAAEQQFYLLWPLVLACFGPFLVRRARLTSASEARRRTLLGAGVLCLVLWGAAVLVQAERLADGERVSRIAFAPDGRSLVLLLGCALGLLAARRPVTWAGLTARAADAAALAAGALLVGCFGWGGVSKGVPALLPMVLAGLASVVLVAVAAHAPAGSLLDAVLGARPVAYLGRISYSLYLWHEVAYRLAEQVAPRGSPIAEVLRFVLAVALAAASYHAVEQGAHRWWANRRTHEERTADPVLAASA